MIADIHTQHEIYYGKLMERGLKLIDEIPAIEPLKNEAKQLRAEVMRLSTIKHDLSIQDIQSASDKIVAFCTEILQQLDYGSVYCQALFLAPTREPALQIEKVMLALGNHLGVKILVCADGTSVEEEKHVHLVVGTSWHVLDMLHSQKQYLCPDHIRMFVLDEAEEMHSGGLIDLAQQKIIVVNYDLSTQLENYLRRIGRSTGQFGSKKQAVSFITRDDERMLSEIKRFYNVVIDELPSNAIDF
ncbi:hypothetical protein HAX54_053194 [Datura stramonium]|uniref:Helicase ATP-binding domain-containing protein n=1 Tax=Datura stramonium TaxID=4076 RepID=A0ABS8T0M0_DATST|nr:hypothetical protein [Datura stramonium]